MSLLLDTHALLWWLIGQPMREEAVARISDTQTLVGVSAASLWEAEIKAALGKLELDVDLADEAAAEGFAQVSITWAHATRAGRLPLHHRDPFDRMLIAQAQIEGLSVVTRDPTFAAYGVNTLQC